MSQYIEQKGIGGFSFFPPVLKFLLIANVVVFFIDNFMFGTLTFGGIPLSGLFTKYFALQPFNSNLPFSDFYPWQVVTYQFMHAGIGHLFFNMFALWMFGSELESLWGSKKFLIYYLLCGIGAALVQMFVSDGPTVGASGSIYGILVAFGLTFPNRPIFMFPIFIPIPAKFYVLIFAGIELIAGFSGSSSPVAHFAHLGGAATGFLLLTVGDRLGVFQFTEKIFKKVDKVDFRNPFHEDDATVHRVSWQRRDVAFETPRPVKRNPITIDGDEITQNKLDIILDKISASGYQNLTDKEKFILTELSKKI
jgi:membrane associated rhomboid family serine protease